MLLSIVSICAIVQLVIVIVGYSISAPGHDGIKSDHFDGKKFVNPEGIKAKGLIDVLKWGFNRKPGKWTKPEGISAGDQPLSKINNGIHITFVNHSTFLIQADGINILTDPVWSERVSPFSWIGPARMRPPGIKFEDLPKIDVVLISHNHYDHLDLPTMRRLHAQHNPVIMTPLGVKKFLDREKITSAKDMDWWTEITLNEDIRIQSVPAQHFSGRGMFDRDETLWCGYVMRTSSGNIYFAGDTGYNENTFKEIGARSGPVKVALIPIGAYKPKWFMSPIHTSPEEALKIHFDISAETSIGIHYGTFPLADDGQYDPVEDLLKAAIKYQVPGKSFITLTEGKRFEVN